MMGIRRLLSKVCSSHFIRSMVAVGLALTAYEVFSRAGGGGATQPPPPVEEPLSPVVKESDAPKGLRWVRSVAINSPTNVSSQVELAWQLSTDPGITNVEIVINKDPIGEQRYPVGMVSTATIGPFCFGTTNTAQARYYTTNGWSALSDPVVFVTPATPDSPPVMGTAVEEPTLKAQPPINLKVLAGMEL